MLTDTITKMDIAILDWIQEHLRCGVLDRVMPFLTSFGNKGWLFIVAAVLLLCIPKYRKWGASLATSLGLGFLFGNLMIKNMVGRTRPYDIIEGMREFLQIEPLGDFSFPSGHTMAAFEFLAVLCCMPIKKIYKVLAGILAFAIAFSRLYLYVHFPSDVLAGMVLGTLFGIMGVRIVEMVSEERKEKAGD